MNLLISFATVLVFQNVVFAGQTAYCSFKEGHVIKADTGQRVSTNVSPKIITSINQLDIDKDAQSIAVSSMQDFKLNLLGALCTDAKYQDFDCYRVPASQHMRELTVLSSNHGQKILALEVPAAAPGGYVQQDLYSCNK